MSKSLHQFFENDHRQIDKFLEKTIEKSDDINMEYYHHFRTRLLRHIKMEEKILFPAAKKVNREVVEKLIPQFRLEHGAITALLVPSPTLSLIKIIEYVLEKHNRAEEDPSGLYEICERLTQGQTQELLDILIATTEVPVRPPNPAPFAMVAAKRALARAGYDYEEILKKIT